MREVHCARRGEQLVQIERVVPELDCERVVVDEGVLAPARDPDRADAEPEGPVEAAQPLLMHMTGRNCLGVDAADLLRRRLRQDDVLVRRRGRVAAQHPSCLHRRLEAAQKLETVRSELLLRPACSVEQALQLLRILHRLGAEIEREQKLVRVAEHARAVELTQQLDALARLRAALRDVAEGDDQVGLTVLQIGQGSAERAGVAVHVGEECDP